ncbi:MAG: hypothetical protein ACLTUC_18665 [Anaerobutyricum soehngenii]
MIEGRHKREHEDYQRCSLYSIKKDETIEYKDKSGDCATIVYRIKDGQHGLYAMEFRPAQISQQGSKMIDLSMGMEDDQNKKISWGLYDLKTNLGGKDDAIKLGEQWQAALRYWYNEVLNYLDGYNKKEGKIGVVTTSYEEDKIKAYIKVLKKKIKDASEFEKTLVGGKTKIEMVRWKKELRFFKNFYEKKFVYLDPEGKKKTWNIDVIIDDHHTFEWEL